MRTPSVKTLRAIFGENAPEAKRLLSASRSELLKNPAAARLERDSYNPQKTCTLRLYALNALGGFHSVDALESARGEYAEYLNAGDSYAATLIRWNGRYRVQSIGDFIETMERQGVRFL